MLSNDSPISVGAYQVYVAGPMTNRPYFNFPAFDSLSDWLRTVLIWKVINPAEHDREKYPGISEAAGFDTGELGLFVEATGFSFAAAMEFDLATVINSHGIVLLPEWETSTGGRIERLVAEATGKDVWLATPTPDDMYQWHVELDPEQKRLKAVVECLT